MPEAALKTTPAWNSPVQDDALASLDVMHPTTYFPNQACAFMPHHQRPFPIQRSVIGMTDACGFNLHEHFTRLRRIHVDCIDGESAVAVRHRCSSLHRSRS